MVFSDIKVLIMRMLETKAISKKGRSWHHFHYNILLWQESVGFHLTADQSMVSQTDKVKEGKHF